MKKISKSEQIKIRKKFWIYLGIGAIITAMFFGYGFYFDIWEKRFESLPRYMLYVHYMFIVMFFTYLHYFTKFLIKYDEILSTIKFWGDNNPDREKIDS